jgi:hypothetical protein
MLVPMTRPALPWWARVAATALAVAAASLPPRVVAWVLAEGAGPVFRGDEAAERAIALGAARWGPVGARDFGTGSDLFDREWAFGTPMMRTACLAQVGLRHSDLGAELAPQLEAAVRELTVPEARAFTTSRWGSDPLDADVRGHDHVAYLGYGGFASGMARAAGAQTGTHDHDVMIARLRARLGDARDRWLETYPGEVYPVDVASALRHHRAR